MKKLLLVLVTTSFTMNSFAQKQRFDVITYTVPAGWNKTENEAGVQVSITDKKTGSYAIAVITKAAPSQFTSAENFENEWQRFVKTTVEVISEPVMQEPAALNGWDIVSGMADYADGSNKGTATLLTATGGGQTVSVVLMTNTRQYQNDLVVFFNSLELSKVLPGNPGNSKTEPQANTDRSSIVGMWVYYITESNGTINGMPQLTGGYMRREYVFYKDGTYLFRVKNWLVYVKDILFVYETGTYTIRGNQITLTPQKGKGEWWGKSPGGRTSEWGKLVRASTDYKLEKNTYKFELKTNTGTDEKFLLLQVPGPTSREGKDGDQTGDREYRYTARELNRSLIDNPPGFKTGFENKPLTGTSQLPTSNTVQSPITGVIWEGTTMEKMLNSGNTSYNTGGFSTIQYTFKADGTYRFVFVQASHFTDTKQLKYETGTYTLNKNQLTIIPYAGADEEWSKVGKTSNGNSDVTNRAINNTWNKKIKTSPRKLEKYTYTFRIGKNGASTALILEKNGRTEREGEGVISYLNETPGDRSVKLPGMFR